MALSSATLKTKLLKLVDSDNPAFLGFPSTLDEVAENWAEAYNFYAQNAVDISGDSLNTASKPGFKEALITSLPEGAGTAALAAAAFETAFIAYWTGAIFDIGSLPPGGVGGNGIFGTEISSVVTTITPNVLYNLLLTEFSKETIETDMDVKAETLADIFHAATTTAVIVTITGTDTTPPPPAGSGPLPIVNVSPIH